MDLGGSKIEAIALRWQDLEQHEVLARVRVKTMADHGYETVVEQCAKAIHECEVQAQLTTEALSVGVGMPGSIRRRDRTVKNSNATCLNGRDFTGDLQAKLARSIQFENDANCFALAEARLGAAVSYAREGVVFGVIMGTGVGGGWVLHNSVWSGPQRIAGEWGHHVIDSSPNAKPCYCGHRGCLERYACGPAVEQEYLRLTAQQHSLSEIAAFAENKEKRDQAAVDAMQLLYAAFARGLANVVNIVDPSCVVLGGGVSNVEGLYTEGVRQAQELIFNDEWLTPVVRNQLGDSAGVYGAAMLCIDANALQ